jgi:serine/threonine protein kinase
MSRPFPSATRDNVLSYLPTPFVKLTDFGLSRFISPASPLLTTRCGSEAYASPELIMGKKYDGRRTDAWALGVVLFAIITGAMPFVEEPMEGGKGRRSYLLKIAKGEYKWPTTTADDEERSPTSPMRTDATAVVQTKPPSQPVIADAARLVSPAVKDLAGRLLVRDPDKRAQVDDVWEMEWMRGGGRPERVLGYVLPREGGEADSLQVAWARRGSGAE